MLKLTSRGILLVLCLLLVGGGVIAQDATEEPEDKPRFPQRELYTALAYGDDVFEPEIWRVTAAEEWPDRTRVTWTNDTGISAIGFLEYLHYEVPVTYEQRIEAYNAQWLSAVLSNYDEWEIAEYCTFDDEEIILYEIAAKNAGNDFILRYWFIGAEPAVIDDVEGDTRVVAFFLLFPDDAMRLMDDYARRFAPDAAACDNEDEAQMP